MQILKEIRRAKGLSQRDLGAAAGLPQSHLSRIESGAVDLQLSSLLELARLLELDVTLVPRKSLPALKALLRGDAPARPAYSLEAEGEDRDDA